MRLIKIDPQNQVVESIKSPGTLEDLYRILDCQSIDVCDRQNKDDSLTVDDDSLSLNPQLSAFSFNDSSPIHGVALLTGTNEEGSCAEPTMSIE